MQKSSKRMVLIVDNEKMNQWSKPGVLLMNIILLLIIAMITPVLVATGCDKREPVKTPDFENHPLYKNYRFSNDEKIIEIGVPVPWASVNHIVEVMKRDEIFTEALRKSGYAVKFYPFHKGVEINYFMRKGLLEGSIIGDMPTLKMASEDTITVMSVFNRGSVSLVSRDIYRVRDLKGKKVAYPTGSISHYYLLNLLHENGLSEQDIRHIPMDTPSMLEAIQDGKIDAFTTFEPTATVYTKIDPTLHTINRSYSSYGFFNIRKDYGERHNSAVRLIIAAQMRALSWIKESDNNIKRASVWIAEESLKMLPVPLERYISELNTLAHEEIVENGTIDAAVVTEEMLEDGGKIAREFEFLKAQGYVPQDKEWRTVRINFDVNTAADVLKEMKPGSSRISP